MGNVALCAPSILSSGAIKVLSSSGELLIYTKTPLKAAEIMLENPGQFLCESTHLKLGHRIPGMCAEEDLERGQLYFLFPMESLHSVLTIEDLKSLSQKTSKGFKHVNFSKIFPEFWRNSEAKTVEAEEGERLSRQRSWEPALETIVETPPHS